MLHVIVSSPAGHQVSWTVACVRQGTCHSSNTCPQGAHTHSRGRERDSPRHMNEPSEVEKLKAKRREEMAAKRAAAAAAGEVPAVETPVEAAAPPPPVVDAGPLGQLTKAEGKADALAEEMAACTAEIEAAADADALDKISKRAAACGGVVGQLQALMDDLDIGDLDDEARALARTRRKAINARVENELEPAKTALNSAVKAAKAKFA